MPTTIIADIITRMKSGRVAPTRIGTHEGKKAIKIKSAIPMKNTVIVTSIA